MNVTAEQQQAAESGEVVRIHDPESRHDYVLLRADLFDRMQNVYDASEWTVEEMDLLAAEAAKRLDAAEEIK